MKYEFTPANYAFAWRDKPVSGNTVNGVGVTERVRPVPVFHSSGLRRIEWELLELLFLLSMPFRLFVLGIWSRWLLRKSDGAVAARKIAADDPSAMARDIKKKGMGLGAGAIGITLFIPDAAFQGYETGYCHAISIAYPMDYEEMEHVTKLRGGLETMRAYIEITRIAVQLAAHIRSLGWPARAFCESSNILHIPLAINAGIGELGKHGSLINREIGPNFRLATVLTDMPLALDGPVDIAVDDLCLGCQRCTLDCPPSAISDSKRLVRGVEKWYVDFDKCVPYFVKTFGCGICIQVCPWSKPGRGPGLSQKLLAKRAAS